jgi:serine/threonine protein kinase
MPAPSPSEKARLDNEPTITHVPTATVAEAVKIEPVPLNREFGDYELLSEIARGGMGIVYRARQKGLNRVVALKMILAGKLAGEDDRKRFRTEAKAAAKLQHPNIVAIYDVGEVDGQAYFSMEYVPGSSLHQRVVKDVMPSRMAAHYMEQIARALHYAHEKGVLHRDLKPANILLDENDQPKLTDFGLAKVVAAAEAAFQPSDPAQPTRTGAVLGTPSYMAPEQAGGLTKEVGPPCDIYGLGAVLYELVTGRPPFKAESPLETVMQVLNQDPLPPRLLNRNVDSDLETICMKCLEKEPKLRYASAEALADDLQRYLQKEPISARSINLLERLGRTLARSHNDKEFRHWGEGLIGLGAIIFLCHLATSVLLREQYPDWISYWGPRSFMLAIIAAGLFRYRPHSLFLPTSSAERVVWAVWLGYMLAFGSMFVVMHVLGSGAEHPHLHVYGPATALSGMAFFIMGAHVWGGCYIIGVLFLALAPAMAHYTASLWAPMWFGTMWGTALFILGARYWVLGKSMADGAE